MDKIETFSILTLPKLKLLYEVFTAWAILCLNRQL